MDEACIVMSTPRLRSPPPPPLPFTTNPSINSIIIVASAAHFVAFG